MDRSIIITGHVVDYLKEWEPKHAPDSAPQAVRKAGGIVARLAVPVALIAAMVMAANGVSA